MVTSIARTRRKLLGVTIFAVTTTCGVAFAQEPARGTENILPATTLFAAFVDDMEVYDAAAANSPMAKIMAEAEVQAFLEKPKKTVSEMAAKLSERLKAEKGFEDFDLKLSDLTSGKYGRCFVALTHITLPGADSPDPDIGFIVGVERRAGAPDWAGHLKALITRAAANTGEQGVGFESAESDGLKYEVLRGASEGERPPILMAERDGLQLFSTSKKSLSDVLARLNGAELDTLAGTKNWGAAQKGLGRRAAGAANVYVDFEAFMSFAKTAIGMGTEMGMIPAPMADSIHRVIEKSGLNAMKSMDFEMFYADGVAVYRGFMVIEGERKGLLGTGKAGTIDLARLKNIPENAASFSLFNMELTPIYDFIMESLLEIDPDTHAQAVASLDALGAQVGGTENPIRVREDFCQNLGPAISVMSPKKASMMGSVPPYLFAMEVRNGDRVVEALRKVIEFAGNAAGQPIKIESEVRKGYTLHELNLGGQLAIVRPAFTVAGDQFYFSTEPGLIKQQMKRLEKSDSTNVTSNTDYQRFAEKLPQSGLVSLSYSDIRYTFESLYDTAISTLPMLIQMSDVEVPIDFQIAPMRETISKHLFGSLDFATDMGDGVRMEGYGSVGGEIVGMSLAAIVAGGVVMASREMEAESSRASPTAPSRPELSAEDQAREDLKLLSSNIVLYRLENDTLPASLEDLLVASSNYPKGLLEGSPLPSDPWGQAYFYAVEGKDFRIWSAGPNGENELGAGDDLLKSSAK